MRSDTIDTIEAFLTVKVITFVISLITLAVGCVLLWYQVKGSPVTAAFTRVGGANRVETAIEASRFWWRHPPTRFVMTDGSGSETVMWGAARCAAHQDAPLLFTSQNARQRRRVNGVIKDWGTETLVTTQSDVGACLSDLSKSSQLRKLAILDSPLLLREDKYKPQAKLAHVVVFAAKKKWADLPDVAVGFALANHLAKAYGQVSFVVVSRYLEANATLQHQLRKEHEPVTGGVILGQTGIISDDTRALLREVITATNRQGILGAIKTSLGDLGAVIGALLALLGLATAARVAPAFAERGAEGIRDVVRTFQTTERSKGMTSEEADTTKEKQSRWGWGKGRGARKPGALPSDIFRPKAASQRVTVWLRSGLRVSGTLEDHAHASDDSRDPEDYVQLTASPTVEREGDKDTVETVWLRLEDIELISIDKQDGDAHAGEDNGEQAPSTPRNAPN